MPAPITCLVISGCQVACLPISKKVAFRHSSISVLSTAGGLPGHGPSSKVKTTSLSRKKSYCLKMLEGEAGTAGRVDFDNPRQPPTAGFVAGRNGPGCRCGGG